MDEKQPGWFAKGLPHLWPPFGLEKSAAPPLAIVRTHDTRLVLADGRELVDGTAACWTAVHGFNHPHIRAAVQRQLLALPDVPPGPLAHEQAFVLATRLAGILPGDLKHVFFCETGSDAIEVAVKIATRYWRSRGEHRRTKFVAFRGCWHGDAFAEMADRQYILDLPRNDATEAALDAFLDEHEADVAAMIAEPLVQAGGGMIFNDELCITRLRQISDRHDLLLIFDETFTGLARTGALFACEAGRVVPDIIVLGKALSGGTLPLAATIATRSLYDAFCSDDPARVLMDASTFAGNPFACAAANASLDLFESEPRRLQAAEIGKGLTHGLGPCIDLPGVTDVRVRGAIGVVELERIERADELNQRFLEAGVWIRPFRNVVPLTPALTIGEKDLDILTLAIRTVLKTHLCLRS